MKRRIKKKVIAHLKGDMKNFKKEANEDRKLMKKIEYEEGMKKKPAKKKDPKKKEKARGKFEKVMHEYKEDKLHSGSKKGPKVHNPKQALAIAFSEERKAKSKKKK